MAQEQEGSPASKERGGVGEGSGHGLSRYESTPKVVADTRWAEGNVLEVGVLRQSWRAGGSTEHVQGQEQGEDSPQARHQGNRAPESDSS